mgnify:CR=1 FL=1
MRDLSIKKYTKRKIKRQRNNIIKTLVDTPIFEFVPANNNNEKEVHI